jgi:hypothetical protein
MTNIISLKNDIANTLKNSNKKLSNSRFKSSVNILENSDFKKFLDLYLNNETEFYERIDGYDGFISTQQLESVNYDNFSEHVFFDSAVEKTNYSFDKAINDFPYDSSKYKLSQYLKKLDGFTRYILKEKVVKSKNYLKFDGNTIVETVDRRGSLLDDYRGKKINNNFNPLRSTIGFDFWIYPDSSLIDESVCVFKKFAGDHGFLITLECSQTEAKICFIIVENSNYFKLTHNIDKEEFSHIYFEVKNNTISVTESDKVFSLFINGKEINKQSKNLKTKGNLNILSLNIENLDFLSSSAFIGASDEKTISFVNNDMADYVFNRGFVGLIDEFRFYTGRAREYEEIIKEKDENTQASESLILYYKFNEPSGLYSNNHIVLDYSGSKLHGEIKNIIEQNGDFTILDFVNFNKNNNMSSPIVDTPLKYESLELNPILFSSFSQTNKDQILEKAAEYDLVNPNSFWKLFPKNIFLEGSDYDNINDVYISKKIVSPRGVIGTEKSINQELIKLISIWARFFDQIKMYIDSFTELLNFNYDTINNGKKIDGMILPLALNHAGFKFREIQTLPVLEKLENKNLTHQDVMSVLSIRQIQNILWKRFLLNSKDYLMTKGTKKSINSVFNSFGLEASKYISIKEINGQNTFNIRNQFVENFKRIKLLDFNKHSKIFENVNFDANNVTNRVFLSTETFDKNKLDLENDWTIETYFRFDKSKSEIFSNSQSLLRIDRKFDDNADFDNPYINLVFTRNNKKIEKGTLKLLIKINDNDLLENTINDFNAFNGCLYYICLRKKLNNKTQKYEYNLFVSPAGSLSYVSSNDLQIVTSQNHSFSDDLNINNIYRIFIGEYKYQNEILAPQNSDLYVTEFQGKIAKLRAYDKYCEDDLLRIKSKDIDFVGEDTKKISLDKLKLNMDMSDKFLDEIDLTGSSNKLSLYNYSNLSKNLQSISLIQDADKIHLSLNIPDDLLTSNIISSKKIVAVEEICLLSQNPEIDTLQETNKVNINSFENPNTKKQYINNNLLHANQLNPEYLYHDDQRLYIDFSAVNFLNKDITKLISINDKFTNILSNSSFLYEEKYVDLEEMANIYFLGRLDLKNKKDINFQSLFQIYKYFDNILEDLLYDAIPSRTNYLGFNFVYESHILERNKYEYKMSDSRIRLSADSRLTYQNYENSKNLKSFRKDDITNQHISSIIKKTV